MQRMCKSCGKWHDLEKPWPEKCYRIRSDSAPHVISDTMDPIKHHGTGRIIDSKRAFSKETRSIGCVELGNESIKPRKPIPLDRGQRREAIKRSIYELRNGRS
jgi:hypothetical protein